MGPHHHPRDPRGSNCIASHVGMPTTTTRPGREARGRESERKRDAYHTRNDADLHVGRDAAAPHRCGAGVVLVPPRKVGRKASVFETTYRPTRQRSIRAIPRFKPRGESTVIVVDLLSIIVAKT